jgi:transcriptional regulator with XRE-family HTH domain
MGTNSGNKSGNKLGENIKHLRRIHGETLQDLGEVLDFENTTIKNYESGKRKPAPQTLQALAKHYGKTVDELLHSDLSELGSIKFSIDGSEGIAKMMEVLFPLSCSDNALKNTSFKKGYDSCRRILDAFSHNEGISGRIIPECFEAFEQATDDSEIPEAIANMIWLIFVEWSQIIDEEMMKAAESLLYPRRNMPPSVKSFLNAKENESEETKKKRRDFINDFDEIIVELLKALKSSMDLAELADYYLALRYVVSMIDTGLSSEMNSAVGMQMMLSFLRLGNPYALHYVEMSVKL